MNCEEGVECLNRYHRETNKLKSTETKTVFLDSPAHDESSHAADGFGYMCIVHDYQPINGKILGYQEPVDRDPRKDVAVEESHDRLSLAGLGIKI